MEIRKQERMGRDLARFGVGTTGLIGRPDVTERDVERALSEAIERGVQLIDTAPYLAEGEKLCGRLLRELNVTEGVVLATRIPAANEAAASAELLTDDEGRVFRDPLIRAFSPESLTYFVEASLEATGLEALPLCLLEGWHDSWLASSAWPEVTGKMAELQRRGKVLRWGLCVPRPCVAHATGVLSEPLIAAVAAPYSVWTQSASALASAATAHGVAFLAQGVMGQGGLSGEIVAGGRFRLGDVRGERFADPRGLVELSRRIAELAAFTKEIPPAAESSDAGRAALERSRRDPELRECHSMAELALRFVLSDPAVTVAVLGCSSVEHVQKGLTATARGALPDVILARVRETIGRLATPATPATAT